MWSPFGGYPSKQQMWAFCFEHGMLTGPPLAGNTNGLTPVHMNSMITKPDLSQLYFPFHKCTLKRTSLAVISKNQGNFGPYSLHYILGGLLAGTWCFKGPDW